MHKFHAERTANIMEAIYKALGEEAINILEKSDIDFYGLFRWHLERTLSIVDTLKTAYGQIAVDIILKEESNSRLEEGKRFANTLGKNTLDDIIPLFSDGNSENIIERNNSMVIVKSTGCLVGRIASDISRKDILYNLHCNCDKDFVEGFNCNLAPYHVKMVGCFFAPSYSIAMQLKNNSGKYSKINCYILLLVVFLTTVRYNVTNSC